MKKLVTTLTDEELLNLVDNNEPVKRVYKSRYLAFISKYNIQPGSNKVYTKALYELFKLDNPDINQQKFTRNLSKFLPTELLTSTVFLINRDTLDIGQELEDKLFEGKPPTARKVRNQRKHIESFLEALNLKPGKCIISLQILIDLYTKWCYKYKRKKLNSREFRHLIPIYLPEVHIRKLRHFKVDESIYKIIPKHKILRLEKKLSDKG